MTLVLGAIALALALSVPRFLPQSLAEGLERGEPALRRWGPYGSALVAVAVVWWVWGEIVPVPVLHDEASYLLQADIFMTGRWTVPSPPLPEFFEQPHVLVVPAVASKYPPGHALLLSIGALAGFPPLVPLLLTAVTAALLFALVARIANVWAALVGVTFWLTAPLVLRFQASYFSEPTTAALLLAAWWTLLEWRDTRRQRWLLLLALAVGWGAITRPLTMLLLAIPIGAVVVRDVARLRRWRDLGLALAAGIAVLAVLPVWSARTTGDWRLWPQELYRRDYMPWDKLGFGFDSTPPGRAASMSRVLADNNSLFASIAQWHRLEVLPEVTTRRALALADELFADWRLPLLPLAIVGMFTGGAATFAAASALILVAGYLPYPHSSRWLVYYLEIAPVAAALTAVGAWSVAKRVAGDGGTGRATTSTAAIAALVALPGLAEIRGSRERHSFDGALARTMARVTSRLQRRPAIVFLRYADRPGNHLAAVSNFADPTAADVWVVHDLGSRNAELLRLAPERTAYYVHEDQIYLRIPGAMSRQQPAGDR